MKVVSSTCGVLMTLVVHGCIGQISLTTEPENVAGILGTTPEVLLPCSIRIDGGSRPSGYSWAVYGEDIFVAGDKEEQHELADYVDLSNEITDQWTDYDLVVRTTAANPGVAVQYQCSGLKGGVTVKKAADVLLVEKHPKCSRDKDIYTEGETATVSCEVGFHGRWGPDMALTGPGQLEDNSEGNLVKWSIKLEVKPEHNGETFTCEAEYGGPPSPEDDDATNIPGLLLNDCRETIVVEYAPRDTKIEQDTAAVGETLSCVSDANPAVDKDNGFVWTLGEETSTGSTFELEEKHQGELNITCCATNTIGGPDCDEKISMPILTTTSTTTSTTIKTTGTAPDSTSESSGPDRPDGNTGLIVGLVITFLVILAIIAGIVFISWRRRLDKREKHQNENMIAEPGVETHQDGANLAYNSLMLSQGDVDKSPPVYASLSSGSQDSESTYNKLERAQDDRQSSTPVYTGLRGPTKQMDTEYEEVAVEGCECTADAVELDTLLHSGSFCEVHVGHVKELKGCSAGMRVVVKTNKGRTTVLEQSMLLGEIKALQAVGRHPNIVQLLAQSVLRDPVMSVCALETRGDLRNYLQESQGHLYANTDLQQMFIGFVLDVASGMAYLSGIKPDIIHRRLATEHVLVGEKQVCKVIGFGFAEHILDREKYERTQGIDPEIRWMAPEQITLKDHSQKSDVWAFGVLMWEVFSCGEVPYAGLSNLEVKQLILSGGALGMPQGTQDGVFDVMLKCWNMEEQKRPDFHSLREVLRGIRNRSG